MKVPSLRVTSIATVLCLARASRWSSSTPPSTPTRDSSRRSSTCTCRSRSCSLAGFVVAGGAWRSATCARATRRGRALLRLDPHLGDLRVAVLLTGAIWAHASWGKWWVWDEPTLVSFLIVFLLYCTYYPLRYAIEDRDRQARYASVFAITAGAFVPLNFIAVRLASRSFTRACSRPRTAACPARCCSPSSSAWPGWRCCGSCLVRFELAAKSRRRSVAAAAGARGRDIRGPRGLANRAGRVSRAPSALS